MTDIIWTQTTRKISELKPYDKNPRRISKGQYQRLVDSIKQTGYNNRLLINTDNTVAAGHQRLKALKELGYSQIDVLVPSRTLTEQEFNRVLVSDNIQLGEFDMDILANHFEIENLIDWGMDANMFPDLDVEVQVLEGEDDPVEVSKEPAKTVLGDIYKLGNHRLMCGDSVKIDDIDKLMNGEKPDMIYTDPPYGIEVNMNDTKGDTKHLTSLGSVAKRRSNYENIIGDTTVDTARDCYNLIVNQFDCALVYWGANYFTQFLPPAKCWLVWNKHADMEENDFCSAELAYTNVSKHSKVMNVLWNGMIREGESNKDPRVHPTQKPIKLALDIFKYLDAGNVILDLFGGSGTTLIAAEKSNRKCYMMELSPHYCDVIVNRWEKLTGNKAELLQ